MITNEQLSSKEKDLIDFLVCKIPNQKDLISDQINHAKVMCDFSPYYLIIKFSHDTSYVQVISEFNTEFVIQVLHRSSVPTVFRLLIRNGLVYMFEVYNADSSYLNYDDLFVGTVFKEF